MFTSSVTYWHVLPNSLRRSDKAYHYHALSILMKHCVNSLSFDTFKAIPPIGDSQLSHPIVSNLFNKFHMNMNSTTPRQSKHEKVYRLQFEILSERPSWDLKLGTYCRRLNSLTRISRVRLNKADSSPECLSRPITFV